LKPEVADSPPICVLLPDHSIEKLGLKQKELAAEDTRKDLPDHSIEKLGLKQGSHFKAGLRN
tara:strand:- start:1653 stop:1838 length:186 start_codon:yes stop_codon:yes gene_type:complete